LEQRGSIFPYSSMKIVSGKPPPPPKLNLVAEGHQAQDADQPIAQDRPATPSQGETQQAAAPGASADPNMEDVLASIRCILREDEVAIPPPPRPSPKAAATDILELTEDMLVVDQDQVPPSVRAVEAPQSPPAPRMPPPVPADTPAEPDHSLLAPAVAAAAAASVGTLLRAVATNRSNALTRGGPSIEDVVRAELRPLLKDWLDAHLPGVVERLVRTEIERVLGQTLS
jgi:cell pole-organizing protein PopZ